VSTLYNSIIHKVRKSESLKIADLVDT
jgi:hypothetical protein